VLFRSKLEKTATEAMINLRPLEDIIVGIINIIESVETSLTDFVGQMYGGDNYIKSVIVYGRKLNLRDENTLLKEIKESKEAGASQSHIKSLNEELTLARFIRSPTDLARNQMLNELEPLIGYTYEEVEKSVSVSREKKDLKINFIDYIKRFENENGDILKYNEGQDFDKRVADINKALLTYITIEPKPND